MAVPAGGSHLGAEAHRDVRRLVDALDEVARHALREGARADEQRHPLGEPGEVEGRLTRRVGGAHDVHLLASALAGLARRRAVVDAPAGEGLEPRCGKPPVGDTRRDDEGPGLDIVGALDAHGLHRSPRLATHDVARHDHLGPEANDLGHRSLGEVGAGEAARKTEVVLDGGTLARLAARCLPLDDHRVEPLGGRVDRRGQAGRAAADDADVVERALGAGAQPERVGDVHGGGVSQGVPAGREDDRQVRVGGTCDGDEPLRLGIALDVVPAVGDVVARQEGLDLVAAVRPAVPDDPHVRGVVRMLLPPVAEQVVEHGVEPLLRWVPRLQQVVVEADVVDRPDRDVGVGVGRQQQPLRLRRVGAGLLEQLDAGHARHALVGGDQGDRLAAERKRGEDVERLGARGRPDDPVVVGVPTAQVAGDRSRHGRVVVDRQDGRFGHPPSQIRPRTQLRATWRGRCCGQRSCELDRRPGNRGTSE